jgi:hypothetical protein
MGDFRCTTTCLTALKPLGVASNLRVRGWRQEAEIGDKGSIWVLPASGDREEADITLPLRLDLGAFALRSAVQAGYCRAIPRASSSLRRYCAPIPTAIHTTSSAGLYGAGRWS